MGTLILRRFANASMRAAPRPAFSPSRFNSWSDEAVHQSSLTRAAQPPPPGCLDRAVERRAPTLRGSDTRMDEVAPAWPPAATGHVRFGGSTVSVQEALQPEVLDRTVPKVTTAFARFSTDCELKTRILP